MDIKHYHGRTQEEVEDLNRVNVQSLVMIIIVNRKQQIHQISVDKNQIEKEKGNERKVKIKYVHGVKKNFWIQKSVESHNKTQIFKTVYDQYVVQLEDEKRNMCYKLWNQ